MSLAKLPLRRFLSTPSARRATHYHCHRPDRVVISIHALREEGDNWPPMGQAVRKISIHALREEGDQWSREVFHFPTPSARRATHLGDHVRAEQAISIHALRE